MKKVILSSPEIARIITRISHEILEKNKGSKDIALVGIRTGGVFLANRIDQKIQEIDSVSVPLGELDITLYRDDLGLKKEAPIIKTTSIPFELTGLNVVLVDDVLFTGRTIRAAMDELIDFGRPNQIQLAVLIDRGHRELPIRADFVGKNLPTARDEDVEVRWKEMGEDDQVCVIVGAVREPPLQKEDGHR
ncbi:MAG: bifunctional pyr operon transcriptional regulator/uracil phosphoribosyltransferase PyrR [Nitrospirae bacterium]|nr:bifunctional pyr operon transcriptional regulator/uracil phosphoribosyltransferase PyrR [Candidatus Troglogloeales bacterium]